MNAQQLQELQDQYQQARDHYLTMKARNVDPQTLQAAGEKALSLKHRLDGARSDSNMLAELDRLTAGMTASSSTARGGRGGSLGTQFLNSETMRWLKETQGTRSGRWDSPASELSMATIWATTLTEDVASGGDLVIADFVPGIVQVPTRRLTVADLLAPGTTTSNAITYMKETTFTNAAATVAEGAAKPESTLVYDAVTDNARKIAHWIPATDEILEDVPQMQATIDSRLRLGVQLTEDDQLLNGDGIAPNFLGIRNRTPLATAIARGTDTNADAIARQIQAITTAQGVEPDGIVMHPTNWLTILLTKTADGAYYDNGGPFSAMRTPMLWGKPVAVTTAMTLNSAFVGAFKFAAQFFRKGGIRVDVSNSHQDFFVKNLIAIRAEERGILTVRRPAAMGAVTGLN